MGKKPQDIQKAIDILEEANEHYDNALAEVEGIKKTKRPLNLEKIPEFVPNKQEKKKDKVKRCLGAIFNVEPSVKLSHVYLHALWEITMGNLKWTTDKFSVMLLTPEYEPDHINHETISEVLEYEVKTEGYKRIHLSGKRILHVDDDGKVLAEIEGYYKWKQLEFPKGFSSVVTFKDTGDPKTSTILTCSTMDKSLDHVCGITMPNPLWTLTAT